MWRATVHVLRPSTSYCGWTLAEGIESSSARLRERGSSFRDRLATSSIAAICIRTDRFPQDMAPIHCLHTFFCISIYTPHLLLTYRSMFRKTRGRDSPASRHRPKFASCINIVKPKQVDNLIFALAFPYVFSSYTRDSWWVKGSNLDSSIVRHAGVPTSNIINR